MWLNLIREFPTTHVLIDNEVNYLRGLSTILPLHNKIFRYFSDAQEALTWINDKSFEDEKNGVPLACFDKDFSSDFSQMCVEKLHKSVYSEKRFTGISAVLVDYDMPGLNGIELCRSIKNPHTQKILLTGFLGEREARHALNKGWIDMFLPKGEDSAQKISELISDADSNYFKNSNCILSAMIVSDMRKRILASNRFMKFFKDVYTSSSSVEFHMLSPNGDYLFVDAKGMTTGFSVQDVNRREEHLELARELSVSGDILTQLETGQVLFCHAGEDGLPERKHWKYYVFPALMVDESAGLIGTFGREVFSDKAFGISAFQPIFDESIKDAVNFLNGGRF